VVTGSDRTGRAGCKITVVALQSSASAAVATAASAAVAWVSPPAVSDAAAAPSQPPPPPLLTLTAVDGGDRDARRVVLMAFGPPAGGLPRLCARGRRCTWTWCRPRLSCCRRGKRRRRCWSYTHCGVLRRRPAAARRSSSSPTVAALRVATRGSQAYPTAGPRAMLTTEKRVSTLSLFSYSDLMHILLFDKQTDQRFPSTFLSLWAELGLHTTPLFGGRQGLATVKTPY